MSGLFLWPNSKQGVRSDKITADYLFGELMKTFSDRIKMALSGMLTVSLLASCSSQAVTETTQPAVPESSPSTEASVSESETTEEETSETSFTVETEEKNNPLLDYSIENPDDYAFNAYKIIYPDDYKVNIKYGFDNPLTGSLLNDYADEVTGTQSDDLSLSDVSYFQYTSYLSDNYYSGKFSDDGYFEVIHIEAIRAILCSEGLRFGIDEIPASYLAKRFPRFYYDAMVYNQPAKWPAESGIPGPDITQISSMWDIETGMDTDYELFRACLVYNSVRSSYMYQNPYGTAPIQQVRDSATGKNVLVPTDTQVEELQEDINSIPGCENISIFTPETPEEFYACYGYYPDELVDDVVYENTIEGFEEYYNSLPEDDQNELYAPILFE